jgi:hypothetical protein
MVILPDDALPFLQGLVHITGGGFPENIPRVVPKGLATKIQQGSWEIPPLFKWVQEVRRQAGWVPLGIKAHGIPSTLGTASNF